MSKAMHNNWVLLTIYLANAEYVLQCMNMQNVIFTM